MIGFTAGGQTDRALCAAAAAAGWPIRVSLNNGCRSLVSYNGRGEDRKSGGKKEKKTVDRSRSSERGGTGQKGNSVTTEFRIETLQPSKVGIDDTKKRSCWTSNCNHILSSLNPPKAMASKLCRRCRIEVNIGDLRRLSTAATSHLRSSASNPHTCQTETSKRVQPLLLTARSTSTSVDLLQALCCQTFFDRSLLGAFSPGLQPHADEPSSSASGHRNSSLLLF